MLIVDRQVDEERIYTVVVVEPVDMWTEAKRRWKERICSGEGVLIPNMQGWPARFFSPGKHGTKSG